MAQDTKPPKVKKKDPPLAAQESWMPQDQKTVRVIANVGNRNLRTVNVVTTRAARDTQSIKTCLQQSGAPPAGYCETVQDSAGLIAGLRTIHIAGYAGPS